MKIKILTAALIAAAVTSCKLNSKEDTVLQIGKYKLTATELESKKKNNKYKSFTNQALEEKLIEEGRILAFAIDHKYDTIVSLNKLLKYASRSYATKMNGFVWNKQVKPKLEITENDIKNAYLKRSRICTLQVVRFPDKTVLDKYYTSAKDFSQLRQKVTDPNVNFFATPTRFPYYPLSSFGNTLDSAKAGDILGPFETEEGFFIVRVAATGIVKQNPYEQEKTSIKQELLSALTEKYIWQKRKEIFSKANPQVYTAAINELTSKFNAANKTWPGVDPDLLLMTYDLHGKKVSYRFTDFEEFVQNEPVFYGALNKSDDVKKMLQSFVLDQYVYAEAQQMGIDNDKEYFEFRKEYQEKIFIGQYKKQFVYPKLSVQENELKEYYQNNGGKFKAFETANVSIYKFKDNKQASQARMLLIRQLNNSASVVSNARSPLPKVIPVEIKLNDKDTNPKVTEALLNLNPNQVSIPLNINNEYWVIALHSKKGLATLPYNYIEGKLKQMVYSQKENQLSAVQSEKLKIKYPTETNTIKEHLQQTAKQ